MKTLSLKIKTEKAVQMVIMDALGKGHANTNELTAYMASATFRKAVKGYVSLFNKSI